MPSCVLEIKAEFENVERMTPAPGDVMWKFDIENEAGERKEGITVDPNDEEQEIEGGKGFAHFVMKWNKGDKHQAYIKITPIGKAKKGATGTYSTPGEWQPVCAFECRGLKIIRWIPGNDFEVTSSCGQVFKAEDVPFSPDEPDWYDVDENNESVSVTELQGRIRDV
jgi:hypothetical protein